eukprot:6192809-Pleurochrysis_carterae.AAC.1
MFVSSESAFYESLIVHVPCMVSASLQRKDVQLHVSKALTVSIALGYVFNSRECGYFKSHGCGLTITRQLRTFGRRQVGYNPDKDVAVLKINDYTGPLKPLAVGCSSTLRVGQVHSLVGTSDELCVLTRRVLLVKSE